MKRKAAEAEAEAEAAEIGLLASRQNGPSQQVNAPTITTTTADVCGSTSDPVKGGEKELGIQDEENLKSKGTLPVINSSAGSKDYSLQDYETENDTYLSGHERDELKEADLETGNKRVRATFRKRTRKQRRSKHKRCRSLEHKEKELGDDNYITKGDELKGVDQDLETESEGSYSLRLDVDGLKHKGIMDFPNQIKMAAYNPEKKLGNDNYITKGDELKEADHLETENKRVPYFGFGKAESFSWSRASTTLVSGRGGPLANADVYDEYFPNHSGSSCVPDPAVSGISCGLQLGYDEYFRRRPGSSQVPNPGIKRPSIVIVSGPPPPPPPPTL